MGAKGCQALHYINSALLDLYRGCSENSIHPEGEGSQIASNRVTLTIGRDSGLVFSVGAVQLLLLSKTLTNKQIII